MAREIESLLNEAIEQSKDAARQIYYAIKLLPKNHPAEANLILALDYIGVHSPKDVGLGMSVIRDRRVT